MRTSRVTAAGAASEPARGRLVQLGGVPFAIAGGLSREFLERIPLEKGSGRPAMRLRLERVPRGFRYCLPFRSGPGRWEKRTRAWRLTVDVARREAAIEVSESLLRSPAWHREIHLQVLLSLGCLGGLLVVHSSSVLGPRGALVFAGLSEAGKSTIAGELLRGLPAIDEETNFVCMEAGGPRLLDWGLRDGVAADLHRRFPIRGLFWLKQSRSFALRPLPPGQAAARLICLPFGVAEPPVVIHQAELLEKVLDRVPCVELHFAKDRAKLRRLLSSRGYL